MNNYPIDNRSFPEIWESCTENEKALLRRLIKEKFMCTKVTMWGWYSGRRRPQAYGTRLKLAHIIGKTLKIEVAPDTLFPQK